MPGLLTLGHEIRADIGRRLVLAMTNRLNISQRQLAIRLGVTSGTITNWLQGTTQPSLERFAEMCAEAGITADEVLGLKPPREGPSLERLESMAAMLEALAQELRGELGDR
jgi:transcriptional regulator with XRE-family HTH domain